MAFQFAGTGAYNHRALMNEENFIVERCPVDADILANLGGALLGYLALWGWKYGRAKSRTILR